MGNTVGTCGLPVVSIHHSDGRVNHYLAPVTVRDLLMEHPDFFVVEINYGRKEILPAQLELHPGGNYYLIAPPRLFSSTEVPSHNCSCCSGCTHFPQVVATYISSNPNKVVKKQAGDDQAEPHQRPTDADDVEVEPTDTDGVEVRPTDADGVELPTLAALLAPEGRSTDIISLKADSPRCSFSSEKDKQDSSKLDFEKSNSKKVSPRNSFDRLFSNSLSFRKEKWLEDMIRGAENQWRRMQHELIMKSKKGGKRSPTRSKGARTPAAMRENLTDSWTPSLVSITESEDACLRIVDARARTHALRSEIEELEQLEQQERDESKKQSLRLKIHEMEEQMARTDSSRRGFLQCMGGGLGLQLGITYP